MNLLILGSGCSLSVAALAALARCDEPVVIITDGHAQSCPPDPPSIDTKVLQSYIVEARSLTNYASSYDYEEAKPKRSEPFYRSLPKFRRRRHA